MSNTINTKFCLEYANKLFYDDEVVECKNYIKKYFYPLTTGQHIYINYDTNEKETYDITEERVIKQVYFNRLPKDINCWYFKGYNKIKTLTCELNQPLLFGNYINTCPAFLHQVKKYEDFSSDVKSKVGMMIGFLKEIWASNNEMQFQFIIKWIAKMARGGKNQSVLYLRAEQGIGKSTFTDFLYKYVIGRQLSLKSGSQPLISNFNSILFCRLLVIYEELENFSTSQWQGVSTRIKRDITSDTCQYERKGVDAFTGKNINNVIINSNVDAIKDDDGRRFYILDLSNKRKGDLEYFNQIYKHCMNDAVGEAFFSYLYTIDLTNFHDQDFPATRAKEDAIVKRLDSVARFIKEKYILRYKDFNTSLKEAFLEYTNFCNDTGSKLCHKIEFNSRLDSLNIKSYKSNKEPNKFDYKFDRLLEIGNQNKWMHNTDCYISDDSPFQDDNLDAGLTQDSKEKDAKIKYLEEQIVMLKNEKKQKAPKEPKDIKVLSSNEEIQKIIQDYQKEQLEINELVKVKSKAKPKKIDKKQFELDLDYLDLLCK